MSGSEVLVEVAGGGAGFEDALFLGFEMGPKLSSSSYMNGFFLGLDFVSSVSESGSGW